MRRPPQFLRRLLLSKVADKDEYRAALARLGIDEDDASGDEGDDDDDGTGELFD